MFRENGKNYPLTVYAFECKTGGDYFYHWWKHLSEMYPITANCHCVFYHSQTVWHQIFFNHRSNAYHVMLSTPLLVDIVGNWIWQKEIAENCICCFDIDCTPIDVMAWK